MRLVFSLMIGVSAVLCADVVDVSMGDLGTIRYVRDEYEHVLQVERISPSGEVMYMHSYQYDEDGRLARESLIGDLGEVVYDGDISIQSPYSSEICEYDENHNLVRQTRDGVAREYAYNECNELIVEERACDSQFMFDEENRLVRVITPEATIEYDYDVSGLRTSRTVNGEIEYPLYFGMNELAIFDSAGQVKELRIPGISPHRNILRPIAIEVNGVIYAPIHDIQGNIAKLINIDTKEVIDLAWADPYGRDLSETSPTSWIFSGKSYDRDADLVYFGARYYSPALKRWLTPDPCHQTENPYEYCFNNPFAYMDPDGEWSATILQIAWGTGATVTAPIWGPYALAVGVGAAAGYATYKGYECWQKKSIDRMEAHKAKEGKQKDGTPKSNGSQNKQADAAKKEIEKRLGKKLTKHEEREFHDYVTGQNYDYHELVEEGYWLFHGR